MLRARRTRHLTLKGEVEDPPPLIGPKPIARLTRDDVEDVRDALDRAIEAKEIRHTTARNVWRYLPSAPRNSRQAGDIDQVLPPHACVHFERARSVGNEHDPPLRAFRYAPRYTSSTQ